MTSQVVVWLRITSASLRLNLFRRIVRASAPGRTPWVVQRLTQRAERKSQPIGDDCDDDADPGHLQTGCPPRTDGDQRFQRTHEKVRDQTDAEGNNHGRY